MREEFHIGLEFWCGAKRWRCADIGSRVIGAICLEPDEVIEVENLGQACRGLQGRRYITDDTSWLSGPQRIPSGRAETARGRWLQARDTMSRAGAVGVILADSGALDAPAHAMVQGGRVPRTPRGWGHGTTSRAAGAANSFGHTTTHRPSRTCRIFDRSSP